MGWSKVGSDVQGTVSAGTGTISVNLPAGLAQNDIVWFAIVCDNELSADGIASGQGWTKIRSDTSAVPGRELAYKVMGASPDSSVTVNQNAAICAYVCQAWRGVDPSNVLDVSTPSEASGGSGDPDAPSITPTTVGALIIAFGFQDDDDSTLTSHPSGYTNGVIQNTGQSSTTVGGTVVMASKIWAANPDNPSAWNLSGNDAWLADTIAMRPMIRSASGTPSIAKPTAAGAGVRTTKPSGTPSLPLPTSAGSATVTPKPSVSASGTPSIALLTAAGVATVVHAAAGAAAIAMLTAAGVATLERHAGVITGHVLFNEEQRINLEWRSRPGENLDRPDRAAVAGHFVIDHAEATHAVGPAIRRLTAAGAAKVGHPASGTASLPVPTASGAAGKGARVASGTPSLALQTAAGAAIANRPASGTPSITPPTSAGVANVERPAAGATQLPLPTSSGAAAAGRPASGAASVALPTSAGAGKVERKGSGTPSIAAPTSAGTVALVRHASGTPSLPLPTSNGFASTGAVTVASGATVLSPLTATGTTAALIRHASGTPSLLLPTSTGTATVKRTASGAATLPLLTATGSAMRGRVAAGTPTTPSPTSAGAAHVLRHASGTPSVAPLRGSGAALAYKAAAGAAQLPVPTAQGAADKFRRAAGTPSLPPLTAQGSVLLARTAVGTPALPAPSAQGATDVITAARLAHGAPELSLPTAAGSAFVGPWSSLARRPQPHPVLDSYAANSQRTSTQTSSTVGTNATSDLPSRAASTMLDARDAKGSTNDD